MQRTDDTAKALKTRLEGYHAQTVRDRTLT